MNATQDKRRRDWGIIILILPLGVAMMMCVGQQAIRMSPSWSVSGDMNSSLDPESAPKQNALVVPPISDDILTPVTWWDTFLTPSGESDSVVVFPPFITFEPSASPTVTASPTETSTPTPTSSVTTTPTPPTQTPTKKPDDDTPTPVTTCQNPAASNFGGPLPCTFPPTTCTDPLANNNGGPLPCIYPVTSTPVGTEITPPVQIGVGTPDGSIGSIDDGEYIVIDLGSPILRVNGPSDTDADLIYYEQQAGSGVDMDMVIISISMDGAVYYVVFNWGDAVPDNNSNVGDVTTDTGTENDNQQIDQPDTGELYGTAPSDTGILIDVDNAPSNPPVGDYQFIAIQAPSTGSTDGIGMDSVDVDEVPIPPP